MAKDMKGLYSKVISGIYPDIPTKYSDDLRNVVKMCLEVNPSKRPTAA
jgi:serine/threonine protein kinase